MVSHLLTIGCWLVAGAVGLPLLIVSLECLLGMLPGGRRSAPDAAARAPVAVLVPAHNEERGLNATLQALQAQLQPGDRLLVIADNCSDATARIARDAGAEVLERSDPGHRGKGYALAAGIQQLAAKPPAVVLIMDADCQPDTAAVARLVRQVQLTHRPAQAIYVMRPADPGDPLSAVSAFAFLVKNEARPRGLARLGQPVLLTGTGMAFPWPLLREVNLATGHIVEDLVLSLELTRAGHGPLLCSEARIESELPASRAAAATQRTRWEHGYLATLFSQTPPLLVRSLLTLRPALLVTALELSVPPLSLLLVAAAASLPLTALGGMVTSNWHPTLLTVLLLALLAITLLLTWARYARTMLPLKTLLTVPLYVLWKIPIYLRFMARRETRWIRTERQKDRIDKY